MLLSRKRRKIKVINVLPPRDRRRAKTKKILPLKNVVRGVYHKENAATKTKAIAEYCHRGNTISESHKILSPGNQKNAATKNTSYGAYNINRILPPGKHYRRKL